MAYAYSPTIGADVANPTYGAVLAANGQVSIANGVTNVLPPHKIGDQVWASDGKRYVFAQVAVGTNLASATAVCTVSPTTFLATATGGSYLAPTFTTAVLGATGNLYPDFAWFGAASV